MYLSLIILFMFLAFLFLASRQASILVYTITYTLFMVFILHVFSTGYLAYTLFILGFLALSICSIRPLRHQFISKPIFLKIAKFIPTMSRTEREALEAGTVGFEGDIFSGAPDFEVLHAARTVNLQADEKAFMEEPLKVLCRMIDDWEITHKRTDLPEEVWEFIKKEGFLGMIIPKCYGGLEFSATAQSIVLATLYGRSISAATTVSVPNSLGPAELLLNYGTEEQKNYYLPRLANGTEIPCFALTAPNAGSDAASILDKGILCKQIHNGKERIMIRLNWNKRYITLCPVATIIGLAFRLFDPDKLLGAETDLGISCALIPANTPGVIKGRRHFPLNTGFLNGPTQGKDVLVPLDCLIGGAAMAGQGWRMLMECLSAGRAISLPSSAMGGTQAGALASGAYARVRKQFNQPIAYFEGIEEPLARIAGTTYIIDAALTMTAAAIDQGEKPSVAGAILKYHSTERARQLALDAMDIHGGKGICLGPKNYLGRPYQNAPISITVEGANILTRSLIIFGQGAIRCHPYLYNELDSFHQQDSKAFDAAFWGHVSFFMANKIKSIVFMLSKGYFIKAPNSPLRRYYQLLHRYSTHFAFMADFCLIVLGGNLKRQEKISARLGDIFSTLYLISAVLKRFHEDKEQTSDIPLASWCCQQLFYECGEAIRGLIDNFPKTWARITLKILLIPFGQANKRPSDALGKELAQMLSTPNALRSRLTRYVFTEPSDNCPIGKLEFAFHKICAVETLERKIVTAIKENRIVSFSMQEQIDEALKIGLINIQEAEKMRDAEEARQEVITVDDFENDELKRNDLKLFVKVQEDKATI